MRDALHQMIREVSPEDVEVLEAADGLSGIKAAIQGIPDLILMDIVLPYLSGYAASVRLKNIDRLKGTRIVGMTSRVEADTREKILTWCDDFLSKPVDPEVLAKILKKHLKAGTGRKDRETPRQKRLKKVTVEIVSQLESRVEELTGLNEKLEKQTRVIRNLYRETKKAKSRIKRLNQIRADFTDLLSHEIKTPLTAITGYSECLQVQGEERLDPEDRELLDKMVEASERIASLVNEISRLSRLKFDLRAGHVCHVRDAIDMVLDRRHQFLEARNLKLEVACDPDLTVHMDRRYLVEMLDHLVKNAVIFCDTGGTVRISGRRQEDRAVIMVEDTGIGIDPTMIGDVLRPLVQLTDVEHHRTHPLRGLGMGLTICSEMAHNVGGTLVLHSPGRDEGASAVLNLPADVKHDDTQTGN